MPRPDGMYVAPNTVVFSDGLTAVYDDVHGKPSIYTYPDGFEQRFEYDANGNEIHYKDSTGREVWRDSSGNKITKEEFDKLHTAN